ncbi:rhamnosyltransferase [Photobacterium damselae]|uniref:rhamnosyltransferase n=1 Tax=Photobacterium damselae TaxID=38293 RepID=UPI0023EA5A90|nr:rhamnosyltransferase [Photobacterium damselae]
MYNPGKIFFDLLERLKNKDTITIIIDNSEKKTDLILDDSIYYHWMRKNCGIAKAQNQGIKLSEYYKSEYVVFLDQDSLLGFDNISDLINVLENSDYSIVAPISVNRKTSNPYSPVKISKYGGVKKLPILDERIIETNFAISSGTVVEKTALDRIGTMDESLFIDYVDTEWCIRAAKKGFKIAINTQVEMVHEIGDGDINCYFFRVPVHSPQRRYYRVRNSFYLLKYKHVPIYLAIREILVTAIQQLIIMIFKKNKYCYGRSYFKAVSDGIRYLFKN